MRVQMLRLMGCHIVAGMFAFCGALACAADQAQQGAPDNNAERILKLLDDTNTLPRLSAAEEQMHAERIQRLYELEKMKPPTAVIEESAGAAAVPQSPQPLAPQAPQAVVPQVPQGVAPQVPQMVAPQLPQAVPPQVWQAAAPQPTVAANEPTERLIEAIEQLQMEIRQLNHLLANPPAAGNTNQAPTESDQPEQPLTPQAMR